MPQVSNLGTLSSFGVLLRGRGQIRFTSEATRRSRTGKTQVGAGDFMALHSGWERRVGIFERSLKRRKDGRGKLTQGKTSISVGYCSEGVGAVGTFRV